MQHRALIERLASPLLSPREAAYVLGVNYVTVLRRIHEGRLPYFRYPADPPEQGTIRILWVDLERVVRGGAFLPLILPEVLTEVRTP